MKYKNIWEKALNSHEEVKYEFSVADRYRYFRLGVLCVLGAVFFFTSFPALGVIVIAGAAFYYGFYLKTANAYAFTDRRVLIHRGWLSTNMVSVEYVKITDVTVLEPFVEKLVTHSGHLAINTAGSIGNEIILKHVERPYDLKKKLDQMR